MSFDIGSYTSAVFDLDGTVWLSEIPIPGAVEFVDRCRAAGLTIAFATNATALGVDHLSARLVECGLGRAGDAVVTGGSVVARTLARLGVLEVIAECPPAMAEAMMAEGVAVTRLAVDAAFPDDWNTPLPGRAVALGASRAATFGSVERIAHLASIGHPLYVTSLDPGFPSLGRIEPGGGMLVAAARALYHIDPIVLGKPSQHYADAIRAQLPPDGRIVVFGDSQRADIGTAEFLGAHGVLVTLADPRPDLPPPHYVTARVGDSVREFEPQAQR
ncbi:MAG TPA: HAD hydrolase-like protein [Ilumatobacter sp.]|jgi:HAD superfamily hydrolase (TIGR01450 family)|nr:HAD hydrolase-like protein [Ilumatobacter sp.]